MRGRHMQLELNQFHYETLSGINKELSSSKGVVKFDECGTLWAYFLPESPMDVLFKLVENNLWYHGLYKPENSIAIEVELEILPDFYDDHLKQKAERFVKRYFNKRPTENPERVRVEWGNTYLGTFEKSFYEKELIPQFAKLVLNYHSVKEIVDIIRDEHINPNRSLAQSGVKRPRNKTYPPEIIEIAETKGISEEDVIDILEAYHKGRVL